MVEDRHTDNSPKENKWMANKWMPNSTSLVIRDMQIESQ